MNSILQAFSIIGPLMVWILLWAVGGWWIARRAFNLQDGEGALAGLAVGLIIENWLANLLGQFMPVMLTFWLAAVLVLLIGVGFWLPLSRQKLGELFKIKLTPWHWVSFAILVYVFTAIGRGLAIFDDYLTLPTTSMIAAGSIPPKFALDPNIRFDYHYFVLLFSAQVMRVGNMHTWNSLDLGRGLCLALSVILTGVWVRRVTRSWVGGFLAVVLMIFGGGIRWILLFLPAGWLDRVSDSVNIIGASLETAPDFANAMLRQWQIVGGGPVAFPFAYLSGIASTTILTFQGGVGSVGGVFPALLLLTHNRWRGWRAWVVTTIIMAAFAMVSEILFVYFVFGIFLVAVIYAITHKSIRLPRSMLIWALILVVAGVISLVEGGVITGSFFNTVLTEFGLDLGAPSYVNFQFYLVWPPKLVSQHLGILNLTDAQQLAVALAEIGPVILVMPFLLLWGIRAYRSQRWFEATWIFATFAFLGLVFVQYSGTGGIVPFTKWQYSMISLCKVFAIPFIWFWVRRRSDVVQVLTGSLYLMTIAGGLVLFAIESIAVPRPVYSYFIDTLDARMEHDFWNKLEPGALVFDSNPPRGVTVFGRANVSSLTWYQVKPEYKAQFAAPIPADLRKAGYSYVYIDSEFWGRMKPVYQQALQDPCVKTVAEVTQDEPQIDFRRLLDIRACK